MAKLKTIVESIDPISIIKDHISKYGARGEQRSYSLSVDGIPISLNIMAMDDHPDKDYFMKGKNLKVGGIAGHKININVIYVYGEIRDIDYQLLLDTIRYVVHHEYEHPEGDVQNDYHMAEHELHADANAINKLGIETWEELARVAPHLPIDNMAWREQLNKRLRTKLR
jgi:hypothetical protein